MTSKYIWAHNWSMEPIWVGGKLCWTREEVANAYTPRAGSAAARVWDEIGPFTKYVALAGGSQSLSSVLNDLSHTAHFVAFQYLGGLPLDAESMFTPLQVEHYIEVGTDHLAPHSRATRRGFLKRIGLHVTRRAPWAPPPRSFPIKKLATPYSPRQIGSFLRVAEQQSTQARKRTATAHLCLGLGAGLFADEYLTVTPLSFHSRAGVRVLTLHGKRPREVPFSHRYFLPLQEIATQYPGEPLIGKEGNGSNDRLNHLLGKVDYPSRMGNPITTRLRTTWMQRMLSIPVGLAEFLRMAGIRTTKSLTDIVPYLPERDPEQWYPAVAELEE